jgi:hypothetical protein
MFWNIEIPIIVRNLINDIEEPFMYSDDRLNQLIVVAAQYVVSDLNLPKKYIVNIIDKSITPDPSDPDSRDTDLVGLIGLKSACLLDQSTFRTKAIMEGIKTVLGPANLTINGNLDGYKTILSHSQSPCTLYENLAMEFNVGNANIVRAVLSPFVGNKFDPSFLRRSDFSHDNKIYR